MKQTETINLLNMNTATFEGKTVTVENGRITEKIDAPNEHLTTYALPGFIDSHCHIMPGYAPLFTAAGVTSVRNTAGNAYMLAPLIKNDPTPFTPHVYWADRMIDGVPGLWGGTSSGSFTTTSKQEAREEVQRQAEQGASFIKVYGRLKREVMEAVVNESERHRLDVAADLLASTDVDALTAAKIGVRFLEHNSGIIQSLIPSWHSLLDEADDKEHLDGGLEKETLAKVCEELKSAGVILTPTLSLFAQSTNDHHWTPSLPFETNAMLSLEEQWKQVRPHIQSRKQKRLFQATKQITEAYHQMGGTILAGTDTPAGVDMYPGQLLHRELQLLVECGLTPFEAIQSATSIPGELFGITSNCEPGEHADLLIVKENPLQTVEATLTIDWIVKGGKWHRPEALIAKAEQSQKDYSEEWYLAKEQSFHDDRKKNYPHVNMKS
ncbi:amidohydrolase family protein [Shouchella sp. 1P09AA]|uniref:amidohydrolase family protein n=1 Tax=unclassified Shouchella TaxID=2893065 RepID=UPI0039A054A8